MAGFEAGGEQTEEDAAMSEKPTMTIEEALADLRAWEAQILSPRDNVIGRVRQTIEAELEAARARIKYAEDHGLQIGVCTSTDCPEGRLAHVYREGSTLSRIFDEWSDGIGLQSKLSASAIREAGLRKALEDSQELLVTCLHETGAAEYRKEIEQRCHDNRTLLNSLASAPADGWQDIATAPKTGERILACHGGCDPEVVRWDDDYELWRQADWEELESPTHWQPLPPAPESLTSTENR